MKKNQTKQKKVRRKKSSSGHQEQNSGREWEMLIYHGSTESTEDIFAFFSRKRHWFSLAILLGVRSSLFFCLFSTVSILYLFFPCSPRFRGEKWSSNYVRKRLTNCPTSAIIAEYGTGPASM
ncbi:MAG: hypothetical protein WCC25_22120 [Candidatus Korobacteraceae bacterium]